MLPDMVMIFGQMNEPPGSRFRVGHAALTMAEYFRDDEHPRRAAARRQYLPFHSGWHGGVRLDGSNAVASRLSAHDGHRVVAVGGAHRQHRYRRHYLNPGRCMCRRTISPIQRRVHTFSHPLRVDCALAQASKRGPLSSYRPRYNPVSKDGDAGHRRPAALRLGAGNPADASRSTQNSRTSLPCSAWSSFRRRTATWSPAPAGWSVGFLTQPFFTTEQFTGLQGELVSLQDALDGCERILSDEFKDYPERALYMIGTIDEAKKKAESGKSDPHDSSEPESEADSKLQGRIRHAFKARGENLKRRSTMPPTAMNLKILLPFGILTEQAGVLRIVAENSRGLVWTLATPTRLCLGAHARDSDLRNRNSGRGCMWPSMKGCWSRPAWTCSCPYAMQLPERTSANLREAVEREFLNLNEREQSVPLGDDENGERVSSAV